VKIPKDRTKGEITKFVFVDFNDCNEKPVGKLACKGSILNAYVSPDGKSILIEEYKGYSMGSGNYALWLMDRSTGKSSELVSLKNYPCVQWSRDSRRIIVTKEDLMLLDLDKKDEQRILLPEKIGYPSYNADESELCFIADTTLWVYNPQKGTKEVLYRLDNDYSYLQSSSWQPGGSEIAFIVGTMRGDIDRYDLYTVDRQTKKSRRITSSI
jgi:Tol biopolymer transport system component